MNASPMTFYKAPPVGISAWHRHWVKGQLAGEASVDCDGCAAPCCTSFEFITLDPHVDNLTQYATRQLASGAVVLKQRADGSCIYFVDGRCSIHARRPSVCRHFDCRMYTLVPIPEMMDALKWSGPARTCAEHLRDTTDARFPLIEKEPDDRTFDERFFWAFMSLIKEHPELDMSTALANTLIGMTDERTRRHLVAARLRETKEDRCSSTN